MVQTTQQVEEDLYDLIRRLREAGCTDEISLMGSGDRHTTVAITRRAQGERNARQFLLNEIEKISKKTPE